MKSPFQTAIPVAKHLKILLFGPSGSGKTLAALSFPRVAIVDAEGGTDLYAGRKGVPEFAVMRAKTITELENAITFIESDGGSTFNTLVVDPITVFYDVQKEAASKRAKDGTMGFKEWGTVNGRMKTLYTKLTNLPVHIVCIARESIEYETENGNLRKVGVKPDADKALMYIFDFVIHMNPDHSGSIVKSRGVDFAKNGKLPQVNWAAFEAIAGAYTDGSTVRQENDDDASTRQANDLRDKDVATEFITHWRGQSLSNADVLAALGVSKLSEWTQGRDAADKAVNTWIADRLRERAN